MHHRLLAASLLLCVSVAKGAEDRAPEGQRRKPNEFAIIFNMGYAGDHLPGNPDDFEKLILACKEAHYTAVLCKYTDRRAEICREHGLKIMVDLLVGDHHIYKNPDAAMAFCRSLRDSDVV